MKKLIGKTRLILVFFLLTVIVLDAQVYIRANQIGYLPNDSKTAVILSKINLEGREFVVKNLNGKISDRGLIKSSSGEYGQFNFTYKIDFSTIRQVDSYYIQVADYKSTKFKIAENLYNSVVDSLITFYRIQRCGYTSPIGHDICHIADATSIIENGIEINKRIDLTGGWHDAGDYTKFLNTTAFTTYLMLFAYEFDPIKFGFDNNNNNVPDILEEAKIGLDWLIRASYNSKFVTQVQNEEDQNVGWRMPEDDPLQFNRPAFIGIGKNLIGIYVATLSLAHRIWKENLRYDQFADKCLTLAENYYSIRHKVKDIANEGTGAYVDKSYEGKMALGSIELFLSTNRNSLLNEAMTYADSARSDYWWSWGDINALAHYKLSFFDKKYVNYLKDNLEHFSETSSNSPFEMGVEVSWGSNNALLGIVLQNILYEKVSNDRSFNALAIIQRDFILGRNPWGVVFISKFGETYTKNFHHQIAFFNGGQLTGALSAGPIPRELLGEYSIKFEKLDRFYEFQTEDIVYIDDRMDYISNEPTISSNATALFVFGFFSNR